MSYRALFFGLLIWMFTPSCSLFLHKKYTWDWRRDHPEYHELATKWIVEKAPALLTTVPKDISYYCPGYASKTPEQRLEFWGLFLSVISWMESSHRTEHSYEEAGILDSSGKNVISRGLLQFSYESATGYLPSLKSAKDLHDPSTALKIGAIALNRFIVKDSVISSGKKGQWKGAAKYWSVLRNNPKHLQIQRWLRSANYKKPQSNVIPPPPHVNKTDYTPWVFKVWEKTPFASAKSKP